MCVCVCVRACVCVCIHICTLTLTQYFSMNVKVFSYHDDLCEDGDVVMKMTVAVTMKTMRTVMMVTVMAEI